jgi:hypothetical protein
MFLCPLIPADLGPALAARRANRSASSLTVGQAQVLASRNAA